MPNDLLTSHEVASNQNDIASLSTWIYAADSDLTLNFKIYISTSASTCFEPAVWTKQTRWCHFHSDSMKQIVSNALEVI